MHEQVADLHRSTSPAGSGRRRISLIARARRRLLGLRAREVIAIVQLVEQGGSRCVLFGGWGVDAVAGRRTRRHADLDLAVDDGSANPSLSAGRTLTSAGFALVREEEVPGALFAHRQLYEDQRGRLVDVHPAFLGRSEARGGSGGMATIAAELLGSGRIQAREVVCLSVPCQLALHRAYQERQQDRADLLLLERLGAP